MITELRRKLWKIDFDMDFSLFFFLVGNQNELVVMDFSANISQTNFLFVEEIMFIIM